MWFHKSSSNGKIANICSYFQVRNDSISYICGLSCAYRSSQTHFQEIFLWHSQIFFCNLQIIKFHSLKQIWYFSCNFWSILFLDQTSLFYLFFVEWIVLAARVTIIITISSSLELSIFNPLFCNVVKWSDTL